MPNIVGGVYSGANITGGSYDVIAPVITLSGDNPLTLELGTSYVEPGYTATDNVDGDITGSVVVTGSVDGNTLGQYILTYTVSDSSGNETSVDRTINVVDTTAPGFTVSPTVSNVITTGADLSATVDENSSIKIIVTSQVASEPSEAAFDASTISTTATANVEFTVNLTGLTFNTAYKAWVETTDAQGNRNVSFVNFTTIAGQLLNIEFPTLVVDIYGAEVTHLYDYWLITQSDIDSFNYNGQAIVVTENGTNLQVTGGTLSLRLNYATVGQQYTLVVFDSDQSNYFRYTGTTIAGT